jgi:hypothetical protein
MKQIHHNLTVGSSTRHLHPLPIARPQHESLLSIKLGMHRGKPHQGQSISKEDLSCNGSSNDTPAHSMWTDELQSLQSKYLNQNDFKATVDIFLIIMIN